MYSKIEQKEFESKSQQNSSWVFCFSSCIQRSNKKNLKANHNKEKVEAYKAAVVFKDRTKRIWKQITTHIRTSRKRAMLYSKIEQKEFESKSQQIQRAFLKYCSCIQRSNKKNLKANHNELRKQMLNWSVVFKDRTKRIWKQITTHYSKRIC